MTFDYYGADPYGDPFCTACWSRGHTVDECEDNPYAPPPAGSRVLSAGRVLVERRPSYAVKLGKLRRRFATKGAAYYALAKRMLGAKYLGPLSTVHGLVKKRSGVDSVADLADLCGISEELIRHRADRAMELFVAPAEPGSREEAPCDPYFDGGRWQAYVRRVARKLRALDEYAARKAASC